MAKFTDRKGREHELVITVRTLMVLKQKLQFDLGRLLSPDSSELRKVIHEPLFLCELCYEISQLSRPEAAKISDQDFYESLAADALDEMISALFDALADFYPRPDQRAFLRSLNKKASEITSEVLTSATTRLEAMTPHELVTQASTNPSVSSEPASS